VGLTDTGNLYGLVRFLTAARREGVKPIVGAVLGGPGRQPGVRPGHTQAYAPGAITAYVLDRGGFARLAGLLSRPPAPRGAEARDPLVEDPARGGLGGSGPPVRG